jgi:hypothetical protein
MNITLERKRKYPAHATPVHVKLFEAEPDLDLDKNTLLKIMNDTSMQFQFESGVFMGRVGVPLDNKFSLWWHKQNTKNTKEFIDSVSEFLGERNKLTSDDISRLRKEYNS